MEFACGAILQRNSEDKTPQKISHLHDNVLLSSSSDGGRIAQSNRATTT
jgi:hypothetical protein